MIEYLDEMDAIINGAHRLPDHKRDKLLSLSHLLRAELNELHTLDVVNAQHISSLVQEVTAQSVSFQDAPDTSPLNEQLSEVVRRFEVSHPRLVDVVQRICTLLSGLGI